MGDSGVNRSATITSFLSSPEGSGERNVTLSMRTVPNPSTRTRASASPTSATGRGRRYCAAAPASGSRANRSCDLPAQRAGPRIDVVAQREVEPAELGLEDAGQQGVVVQDAARLRGEGGLHVGEAESARDAGPGAARSAG